MDFLASAVLLSLVAAVDSTNTEQHLIGPNLSASFAKRDHLAIHVPDIPTEYRASMSANELWALNAFGEPRSSSLENELWTTPGAGLDWWFARQLVTSPLRVLEVQDADIVFVPATIRYFTETTLLEKFFEEAPQFLPALKTKPHILILTEPLATLRVYMPKSAEFLLHGNGRYFTYISKECFDRDWPEFDYTRILGAPHLANIHWHRGSHHLLSKTNMTDILQHKKYTAIISAKFRDLRIRFALRDHCMLRSEKCLIIDWGAHPFGVADDLSMNGSKQAWYQLMPRGDTTLRKSFYHAILTSSIPVVFEDDYFKYAPFADVLDYHDITETYPGDAILANNSATEANIVDILEQKIDRTAVRKLEKILEVQHVFQYMINPVHELINFNDAYQIDREDDAFTFTMKGLIRHLCNQDAFSDRQCKRKGLGHDTISIVNT